MMYFPISALPGPATRIRKDVGRVATTGDGLQETFALSCSPSLLQAKKWGRSSASIHNQHHLHQPISNKFLTRRSRVMPTRSP